MTMLDCTCVNFENIFEKHNPDVLLLHVGIYIDCEGNPSVA